MAPRSWDEYLFREHASVRVDPWSHKGAIRLLDVLIKKGRRDGREVLGRAGSLLTTGHWSEEAEESMWWYADARAQLILPSGQLNQDYDDEEEEQMFEKGRSPDIRASVRQSPSFLASIFGAGFGGLAASAHVLHGLAFEVRNVSYERLARDALLEVFGKSTPLWAPDVDLFLRMGWKTSGSIGSLLFPKRDLWIVTEIMYATKMIVRSSEGLGVGGNASIAGVSGVPGLGVQAKVQTTRDGCLEITAPTGGTNFPFALKAFRLSYQFSQDATPGPTLRRMEASIGNRQLEITRADEVIPGPDEDPHYHMADLLEDQQSPPDDVERNRLRLPMDDEEDLHLIS